MVDLLVDVIARGFALRLRDVEDPNIGAAGGIHRGDPPSEGACADDGDRTIVHVAGRRVGHGLILLGRDIWRTTDPTRTMRSSQPPSQPARSELKPTTRDSPSARHRAERTLRLPSDGPLDVFACDARSSSNVTTRALLAAEGQADASGTAGIRRTSRVRASGAAAMCPHRTRTSDVPVRRRTINQYEYDPSDH